MSVRYWMRHALKRLNPAKTSPGKTSVDPPAQRYTFAMRVDLTPRSAEIIAREQARNGAISPEQLIEQALEAFSGIVVEPSWFTRVPKNARN